MHSLRVALNSSDSYSVRMAKKKYQIVSDQLIAPQDMGAGPTGESCLSPQRAFIVQFREEMDATPSRFSGRAEHLVSGHATRFHSPKELLTFFAEVLNAANAKPP